MVDAPDIYTLLGPTDGRGAPRAAGCVTALCGRGNGGCQVAAGGLQYQAEARE